LPLASLIGTVLIPDRFGHLMNRLLTVAILLFPSLAAAAPPAVTAVAYHPDRKTMAAATGGTIHLFDTTNGGPLSDPLAVAGRVTALGFDPRGQWLAVAHGAAGKAGEVQLFRFSETGKIDRSPIATITGHKDAVYALAFSPDGSRLATAGYDRVIHIWKVPFGLPEASTFIKTPELTLRDHSDTIYALAWHPDGKLLASGSADRSVKIWEAATGKRLHTLSDATEWVYCLAWSPDKRHLAGGGVDKTLRVWEVNAENARLALSGFAHEQPLWRLAYTADGKAIYTAGEDRVIKQWDAAKLTETRVYEAQKDSILDLALRPDGKQLAVARFDGVLALLDPETGKPTSQPLPAKPAPKPQPAKVTPPKADRLTPNSGLRGATTRVVVTGSGLDRVAKVTTSNDAVRAAITNAERTTTRLELDVTTTAAAPIGAVQFTLEADAGKSAPVAFAIDWFAAVAEAGATDSARQAQDVNPPVTLVGAIDRAGDVDYYRFDAKAGDEVGVQAITTEIGSKLEPVLIITDAAGTVLAEGGSVLGFRTPRAGGYSVGIRDREYRGGADYTYRLHIGPVPVVTGVFPLAAQRGRTTLFHLDGVNLGAAGKQEIPVTIPATAVVGSRVPVPLTGGPNRPLGVAEVVVSEFASVVVAPLEGAELRVPGSADGILTKPNEAQSVSFAAKKGQPLVVEVLARRAGSPVDPVIEILDAQGKPVPRALLRATAKTFTVFRDHDSSGPGIRIETWNDLAIDDYLFVGGELMRIVALPKNPDDDCQFYQVAGRRVGYLGTTPTHHAQGSPMYRVEMHPPEKTFPPNGLPLFTINYANDDGGAGYGKDSLLLFDPPADGSYQVRVSDARGEGGPTHAYRVTVRPPRPDFTVSFNPTAPSVWKGGGVPVFATVTRTDSFDGPVRVKLDGLPAGLHAPETFVEAGQTTTAFTLFAEPDATVPPNTQLKLIATARVEGKEVTREATGGFPKIATVGDIVTTTRASEITIAPGRESRFTVDIERKGKFAGRVPVEVRGLPHGVRVLNIGLNGILITERETSREVVLYAEPWVKPMEHPIVVSARHEGKGTEYTAKSVMLKVK
jgi:WD40 repeat protein